MHADPIADRVKVIQSNSKHVTLYSQQVRALNLAWELRERYEKKEVMVIGAGAAGLTFAAAAARLGARVSLCDCAQRPMSLQRGCRHRYLHPHISEWPGEFCWKMDAGLPLLDWSEGPAAEVAFQLSAQFAVIAKDHDIDMNLPVSRLDVSPELKVSWIYENQNKSLTPEILVFAIGLGKERTVAGLPVASYWRADPIDQSALLVDRHHRQAVSGIGDGGLIDLIRTCVWDFDHGAFWNDLAAILRGSKLEKAELCYEKDLNGQDDEALWEKYEELKHTCRGDIAEIDQFLTRRMRKHQEVILFHKEKRRLSQKNSQPLNRLLAWRLLEMDGSIVETRRGKLLTAIYQEDDCRFHITYEDEGGDKRCDFADGVTVRHGPQSLLTKSFPKLEAVFSNIQLSESTENRPKLIDKDKMAEALSRRIEERLPELHVEPATDLDSYPGERGNKIYRLFISIEKVPPDVWQVSYDLHPGLQEKRKERSIIRPVDHVIPAEDEDRKFRALIHTDSDYEVRVRLSNGREFTSRLICGVHKWASGGLDRQSKAEVITTAILSPDTQSLPKCSDHGCICQRTTKKSIAAMALAWLWRKVRHL
jgi:hypothetical protein